MSTTFATLPNEPIIIHTIDSAWDTQRDLPMALQHAGQCLDAAVEPCFYIAHIIEEPKIGLQDIIQAATQAARGASAVMHHPNLKGYLVVGASAVLRLAAKGLNSETFGRVPVYLFDTLDEALSYARSNR